MLTIFHEVAKTDTRNIQYYHNAFEVYLCKTQDPPRSSYGQWIAIFL